MCPSHMCMAMVYVPWYAQHRKDSSISHNFSLQGPIWPLFLIVPRINIHARTPTLDVATHTHTHTHTHIIDTPQSPDRGGMTLFRSRQERLDQLLDHDSKRRGETILIMGGLTSDPSMSAGDRTVLLRHCERCSNNNNMKCLYPTSL